MLRLRDSARTARRTLLSLAAITAVAVGPTAGQGATGAAPESAAGERSGLYMPAAAYAAGRLTYEVHCRTAMHKIDRHTLLGRSYVDLTHEGRQYRHAKREVYGYRGCDGNDVRFVGNQEFALLSAGPLYLYSAQMPSPGAKGTRLETRYFFSATAGDSALPLTRANLKQAYPDDHRFHDLLDQSFRSEAELAAYDAFHKQYRVARTLTQSRAEWR